jgi:hypothetical protein
MSYGVDQLDVYPRGASYVDRIAHGTKRGDLPVQEPTKYESRHQAQDRQGARHYRARRRCLPPPTR